MGKVKNFRLAAAAYYLCFWGNLLAGMIFFGFLTNYHVSNNPTGSNFVVEIIIAFYLFNIVVGTAIALIFMKLLEGVSILSENNICNDDYLKDNKAFLRFANPISIHFTFLYIIFYELLWRRGIMREPFRELPFTT